MGTGAFGINCDVCRLHLRGICSSCGAGTGPVGIRKLGAQKLIFHGYCPVLKCANDHRIAFCTRDCRKFPCTAFEQGPTPYSEDFLAMQSRRRKEGRLPSLDLKQTTRWTFEEIPTEYWEELTSLSPVDVCKRTRVSYEKQEEAYRVLLLDRTYWVYPTRRAISPGEKASESQHRFPVVSFLEALILLVYLLRAKDSSLTGKRITEREIPGGDQFFQGPHELARAPVLERFGKTPGEFLQAGLAMNGEKLPDGDASFRLQALPRIPLEYILWAEDEEFSARLTIVFDASVGEHLPLDAIWALVHLVTGRLCVDNNQQL